VCALLDSNTCNEQVEAFRDIAFGTKDSALASRFVLIFFTSDHKFQHLHLRRSGAYLRLIKYIYIYIYVCMYAACRLSHAFSLFRRHSLSCLDLASALNSVIVVGTCLLMTLGSLETPEEWRRGMEVQGLGVIQEEEE